MQQRSSVWRKVSPWLPYLAILVLLLAEPAWAATGAGSSLASRLRSINAELVTVGGVLTVTGFIWALLSILVGMAGAAKAFTVLVVGLAIAFAPQIVSGITGLAGGG